LKVQRVSKQQQISYHVHVFYIYIELTQEVQKRLKMSRILNNTRFHEANIVYILCPAKYDVILKAHINSFYNKFVIFQLISTLN
jgi:hypothetical protein